MLLENIYASMSCCPPNVTLSYPFTMKTNSAHTSSYKESYVIFRSSFDITSA